jgi:uncharacterized protein (DUF4415 family)
MSKSFEPLTDEELQEISRGRALARERARRLIEIADPGEDAAIAAAAEADPDAQPLTDEELARMRPAHEVVPRLVAAQLRRGRGRPKTAAAKQQVSLRLDPAVVEHFKATGAGWRTRINDELLSVIRRKKLKR